MIPELGHLSLLLSLCLYLLLASIPLIGVFRQNNLLMATSRSLATGGFVFVLGTMVAAWPTFEPEPVRIRGRRPVYPTETARAKAG